MLIGSHNLLADAEPAASSTTQRLRPLIDEFLHGAERRSTPRTRAALFRLAWDFVGSSARRAGTSSTSAST